MFSYQKRFLVGRFIPKLQFMELEVYGVGFYRDFTFFRVEKLLSDFGSSSFMCA